jgi:hypothetical protein
MLRRSTKRDGEFIGVAPESAIAQVPDYVYGLSLIGAFVVNLLVEHVKAPSLPLFCSRSLRDAKKKAASEMPERLEITGAFPKVSNPTHFSG